MPRSSLPYVALMATSAAAAVQSLYGQCGGEGWTGPTTCVEGAFCSSQNPWYYQCLAGTPTVAAPAPAKSTLITLTRTVVVSSVAPVKSSSVVVVKTSSTKAATSAKPAVSSVKASSKAIVSSKAAVSSKVSAVAAIASSKAPSATAAASTGTSGQTQFAGINIAGFDFGCGTDGTCTTSGAVGPITSANNGTAQMQHFVRDDKLNAFRLPVGWQYLVNNQLGGTIDATNLANYDELMQGCLATGSLCIIDIHNYARWNGQIIGQGGPTNDQFTNLWTQLAKKYASTAKVAFGVMNEPHDLTVSTWADTVQAAVTAIRNAGAKSQYILMPGTDYTSAGSFISSGSAAALLKVTNPDGSTDGLIFDVHRYLDSDNSGTNAECVTNNIDTSFLPLATWLRTNKRMAILSETGGGSTTSCETYVCQELDYLDQNADVYLGWIGWAAGSFDTSYVLSLTPSGNTDKALAAKCFSRA